MNTTHTFQLIYAYIEDLCVRRKLVISTYYNGIQWNVSTVVRKPEHIGTTNFTTFMGYGATIEHAYFNLLDELRMDELRKIPTT